MGYPAVIPARAHCDAASMAAAAVMLAPKTQSPHMWAAVHLQLDPASPLHIDAMNIVNMTAQ
jgi:hypothetical protein